MQENKSHTQPPGARFKLRIRTAAAMVRFASALLVLGWGVDGQHMGSPFGSRMVHGRPMMDGESSAFAPPPLGAAPPQQPEAAQESPDEDEGYDESDDTSHTERPEESAFVPEIKVTGALNPNFNGVYKMDGSRLGFPSYASITHRSNAYIYPARMKDGSLHFVFDEDEIQSNGIHGGMPIGDCDNLPVIHSPRGPEMWGGRIGLSKSKDAFHYNPECRIVPVGEAPDNSMCGATPSPTMMPTFTPTIMPTHMPTQPDCDQIDNEARATLQCFDQEQERMVLCCPTEAPTLAPTLFPTTLSPTKAPTGEPTAFPTSRPTEFPTPRPTFFPTPFPTPLPTSVPTLMPTFAPTGFPTPVSTEVVDQQLVPHTLPEAELAQAQKLVTIDPDSPDGSGEMLSIGSKPKPSHSVLGGAWASFTSLGGSQQQKSEAEKLAMAQEQKQEEAEVKKAEKSLSLSTDSGAGLGSMLLGSSRGGMSDEQFATLNTSSGSPSGSVWWAGLAVAGCFCAVAAGAAAYIELKTVAAGKAAAADGGGSFGDSFPAAATTPGAGAATPAQAQYENDFI